MLAACHSAVLRSVFRLTLASRVVVAVCNLADGLPALRIFRPDVVTVVLDSCDTDNDVVLRSMRASSPRCPLILMAPSNGLPDSILTGVHGIVHDVLDLNALLRLVTALAPRRAAPRPQPFGAPTLRALAYLADHHAEPVSTTALAARASLSADHFAHLFRADTGMTVTSFIGQLRVDVAKGWLTSSDRKLAAIAEDAGCADASHLSRLFRRYAGCTPGAYRRIARLEMSGPALGMP